MVVMVAAMAAMVDWAPAMVALGRTRDWGLAMAADMEATGPME
jgi:hypothetical protein